MTVPEMIKCFSCADLDDYRGLAHKDGYVVHTNAEQIEICKKNRHTFKPFPKRSQRKTNAEKITKSKTKGCIGDLYVESVIISGHPKFLCKKPNGEFFILDSIEFEEETIQPSSVDEVGYIPYSFSSDREVHTLYNTTITKDEILEQIKNEVDHFIVVIDESKSLLQGDYLLSYCQEWISTVHYTFSVGETESGKSSILHLARWLCYRCLYGEDIPMADIYNFLGQDEEGAGTIAEDEAQDIWLNREKMNMYKNSYSKGSKKSRIVGVDSLKKRQVHYRTFCPKWFAGERIPANKGFNERLAIIYMVEGEPKGNIKRPTKDEIRQLHHLRNKMLIWKLQNIGKDFEAFPSSLKGRDQELWEDYLSLGYSSKYQQDFERVVEHYTKQRHDKIKNSIEAVLFKLICDKIDGNFELVFAHYWEYLVNNNSEIPGNKNETSSTTFYPQGFYEKITHQYLAKLFEDKFQGKKDPRKKRDAEKKQHQITMYRFDREVLQKLVKKYGTELSIDHPLYVGELCEHGPQTDNQGDQVDGVKEKGDEVK